MFLLQSTIYNKVFHYTESLKKKSTLNDSTWSDKKNWTYTPYVVPRKLEKDD